MRPACDADSWPLVALIGACWAEYPGCVMDAAGEYPELLAPASHFSGIGGQLWVLPEGAWLAACVGLEPADDEAAELVKLYVARHRRGQGLGSALVAWVEENASDLGARRIELWSDTRFDAAHRLYQRCGYRRSGAQRQLHDLSGTTEYQFWKVLGET